MAEPSNESLVIERSLLELYEPNAHAAPMMAIDFLHDLARRSATMPSALSKDLLNRQRVTTNLRLRTEAALLRVACTHADVRIEDNGHGAWLVSGLQPRANTAPRTTATAAPACPDGHARPLPSRSERSSRHPLGPKRARLANPGAEILPPGTRFHWKGRAYEIHDRHDRVQSTAAKQHCHLRRDGEPLGSSYARDREVAAEAVRLAEADFDYAQSMLSLAEAQSAREQKGKHRPPDARAAQRQRWAETVEHWASEADAAWRVRSEARGRLRPADVALRGEQARYAQLHARGYVAFARGEHGVRIPSAETVAGEVGSWTAVFNKGIDKKSKPPGRGEGGRWQGRKTASPGVDAPSITAVESDVREWLGPDGLNWLATASGEAGGAQKTVEAHAMLRGVEAAVGANGQYSGKPVRDGGGRFVDATTPQQRPIHADACAPNSHAKDGAPWGDAHLSMLVSLQDNTKLVVYPFDKGGEEVPLALNAGDVVIFRGDLVHTGAAYDACNLSLHLYVDSPRAPHQRDAKATYAVDAKGGARAHWPIAE